MIYQVKDEDRCLAFIRIFSHDFFVYALEDNFYLIEQKLDFEPIILPKEIDLEYLFKGKTEEFLAKYQQSIKNPKELFSDFYELFSLQGSFFDLIDFDLLPSVIIDFNEKILYQAFSENCQPFYRYVPNDWQGVFDESFWINPLYHQKYRNCFYWIKDDCDYLQLIFQNEEDLF